MYWEEPKLWSSPVPLARRILKLEQDVERLGTYCSQLEKTIERMGEHHSQSMRDMQNKIRQLRSDMLDLVK